MGDGTSGSGGRCPTCGMVTWHRYEPDFVARLFAEREDDDAVHLIVECKGVPDAHSERKKQAVETRWIPAVQASGQSSPLATPMGVRGTHRTRERLSADLNHAIREARKTHPTPIVEGSGMMAKKAATKKTGQYMHTSS